MKLKTGIPQLDAYTEGVKSGKIVVCKWIQLAVDRHYKDLERQKNHDFPYYFDRGAAEHYVEVFERYFQHYEGVIAGKPVIFEPWQWFTYAVVFGWLHKEPFHGVYLRRYRKAYIIIPKKQGKSFMSGGTAIYMMDFDEWPGAQCYIMAKSVKHAKDLGYRAATSFVEKSDELSKRYKINLSAGDAGVYYKGNNNAFYKPITAKVEGEDGRNVHFFGPDETKDWKNTEIYDLMVNGTVNAPNSLVLATTTAGSDMDTLGYQHQKYIEQILQDVIEDETTWGVIFTIDEEDKLDENGDPDEFYYEKEEVWRKANPNFGVSVYPEALQAMLPECRASVGKRIAFKTKHLNEWHTSVSTFLKPERWKECEKREIKGLFQGLNHLNWDELPDAIEERYASFFAKYRGQQAYAGLDLGSVDDLTAFVLVIDGEEDADVIPLFWMPEETMEDRPNIHLFRPWVEQGYIQTTPGPTTDHNFVRFCINKLNEYLDLKEIYLDRSAADKLMYDLQDDGLELVKFGQGYMSMKEAVNAMEKLTLEKKLNYGMNPVLRWMNGNAIIHMDAAGNRKFNKDKSSDKIDGIVAAAMGIYASYINQSEHKIIYNERGFIAL
jgi:phage terminase large subunit-like protein